MIVPAWAGSLFGGPQPVEVYFKTSELCSFCSDVDVFQSAVLFLGYVFDLPRVVIDVGLLPPDVITTRTGFICESRNLEPQPGAIQRYFGREIYHELT